MIVTKLEFQKCMLTISVNLEYFYKISDLVWQEGFLIDFTQKKIVDKWVRKFLSNSSYLFSERVMFDFIIKIYTNLIMGPLVANIWYDLKQPSSFISCTTVTISLIFAINDLIYFYNIWL